MLLLLLDSPLETLFPCANRYHVYEPWTFFSFFFLLHPTATHPGCGNEKNIFSVLPPRFSRRKQHTIRLSLSWVLKFIRKSVPFAFSFRLRRGRKVFSVFPLRFHVALSSFSIHQAHKSSFFGFLQFDVCRRAEKRSNSVIELWMVEKQGVSGVGPRRIPLRRTICSFNLMCCCLHSSTRCTYKWKVIGAKASALTLINFSGNPESSARKKCVFVAFFPFALSLSVALVLNGFFHITHRDWFPRENAQLEIVARLVGEAVEEKGSRLPKNPLWWIELKRKKVIKTNLHNFFSSSPRAVSWKNTSSKSQSQPLWNSHRALKGERRRRNWITLRCIAFTSDQNGKPSRRVLFKQFSCNFPPPRIRER